MKALAIAIILAVITIIAYDYYKEQNSLERQLFKSFKEISTWTK